MWELGENFESHISATRESRPQGSSNVKNNLDFNVLLFLCERYRGRGFAYVKKLI